MNTPTVDPSDNERIMVELGPALFRFGSQINWVNKASSWYRNCGVPKHRLITIDAKGRICTQGSDFMRAEKEGTYPITVYAIDQS